MPITMIMNEKNCFRNILLHLPELPSPVTILTSKVTYQHVFGKSWRKGMNTAKTN